MDEYMMACLSSDPEDMLAYTQGQLAMMTKQVTERMSLEGLMELRVCARRDPFSAYNLALYLSDSLERGAKRPKRREVVNKLYKRCIDVGSERLSNAGAEDFPEIEGPMRDIVSRALVNIGNSYQYDLKLNEVAYDFYRRAATMFDNEIAYMNMAQMNFLGLIQKPSGKLALEYYRKTVSLGRECFKGRSNCPCIMGVLKPLQAVPEDELESALPSLREQYLNGTLGRSLDPTPGVHPETAQYIEAVVGAYLETMDASMPIVMRVTLMASLIATMAHQICNTVQEAEAFLKEVVDGMFLASMPNPLMPTSRESATMADCDAFKRSDLCTDVVELVELISTTFLEIAQGEDDDTEGRYEHFIKAILLHASSTWRGGLVNTALAALVDSPDERVLFVVPIAIGNV